MPTTPGLSRKYPDCYLAPRKYALVISCVDCRLLDDLVRFLDHDNLTNRYYHLTFAGAAIGLSDDAPVYYPKCEPPKKHTCEPMDFSQWKQMLYDHLELVLKLTKGELTDVYIVEHMDCGAYRTFLDVDYYKDPANPDLEAESDEHRNRAEALAEELGEWFSSVRAAELATELKEQFGVQSLSPPIVRGFLMDLRGNVKRLFEPLPAGKRGKKSRQIVGSAGGDCYV